MAEIAKAKAEKANAKAEREKLKLEAEREKYEKKHKKEEEADAKKKAKDVKKIIKARRSGSASVGACLVGTAGFVGGLFLHQGLLGAAIGIVVGAIFGYAIAMLTEKKN